MPTFPGSTPRWWREADKRALHESAGTVAVDMESHIAAKIAARHGVPFAACRVIIDPAERTLPPAALVGMRADGRPDVFAVIRSLCQQPRQVFALLRVVADAHAARSALFRGRRRLGEKSELPRRCRSAASTQRSERRATVRCLRELKRQRGVALEQHRSGRPPGR